MALDAGCSLAELAVAWTLAWPMVAGAIVGARRLEQVDGWAGAASIELDEGVLRRIAGIIERTGAGQGESLPFGLAA